MASERLLELLNRAIAREIQVSIQYMWQHVTAKGLCSPAVRNIFRSIAITEMKHAEALAERLDYLGGKPTTQPAPITVGESLEEMIRLDLQAEEEAIELYRQIIDVATQEGDHVTAHMMRSILADEEEHHNEFKTLLGE
ncbi:MAG: ferritin-like domain-containing protein [Armatimonadota bacterium]|nr:ferritin-like domain-containing protein [Armatimonadota bacterium]MCX7777557.1 ferritin-like domain-containing protein [Armatimonadota bacterium]MDW8025566.1 ferritin-like domain-containing protein [Armatimonadota bacterium]